MVIQDNKSNFKAYLKEQVELDMYIAYNKGRLKG